MKIDKIEKIVINKELSPNKKRDDFILKKNV